MHSSAIRCHPSGALPAFPRPTELSRADFGIDAWKSVIGDRVELRMEVEATRSRTSDGDMTMKHDDARTKEPTTTQPSQSRPRSPPRHDHEKHRRPLGPGKPGLPLAHHAADPGPGHRRPDHGRASEDAEVFLGLHRAQVHRHHRAGAGARAAGLAPVCGQARTGAGHADLAGTHRQRYPLAAVRADPDHADFRLAVRLGQWPASVPLVRLVRHAQAEPAG